MTVHAAIDAPCGLQPALRFVAWGSYDSGKPRVRMLLDALRDRGALASEIHVNVWHGIRDKAVAGWWRNLGALLRLVVGYPLALLRFAKSPRDRVILLLYPAIFDVFVLWPLARLRGQTIVFDAFISFHDTIVGDRKRLAANTLLARGVWHLERLALKLADVILVDTDAHGCFFASTFRIPRSKFLTILVGAEPLFWGARDQPTANHVSGEASPPYALFYGQFIPLHGIETILDAVVRTEASPMHWFLVGSGQEDGLVRDLLARRAPGNLTWLPWVDYERLPELIRNATVSLGIFGGTDKASRVIPNKMFQVLAVGGSIITRDSPAVRSLAAQFPGAIRLVPPADPEALAGAVAEAFRAGARAPVPPSAQHILSPDQGVANLLHELERREKARTCTQ